MRIRTIKPEWLDDERLIEAGSDARVLSIALIVLADDYGRGRAGEFWLAGRVFPAHAKNRETLAKSLGSLAPWFVRVYEVKKQRYYQIQNWEKHQKVDRPGKPRVPAPDPEPDPVTAGDPCASSTHAKDRVTHAKDPGTHATDQDQDQDQDRDHSDSALLPQGGTVGSRGSPPSPAVADGARSGAADAQQPLPGHEEPPKVTAKEKANRVWGAYSAAFLRRYEVEPKRNARVNTRLRNLVEVLGADDAPQVAGWYVEHNSSRYVRGGHSIRDLLSDAESLHAQWSSGRRITRGDAREAEFRDEQAAKAERARRILASAGGTA